MATPRKKFRVSRGNSHITVYPYGEGWRYGWRRTVLDKWKYVTRPTKAEATSEAEKTLADIEQKGTIWTALPPARLAFHEAIERECSVADQDAILRFIADRKKSGLLPDAVARFMAHKVASSKKGETDHLAQVRRDLEHLAAEYPKSLVIDITVDQLAGWWNDRTGEAGDHRRKGIRTTLVTFWKWARKDGIAGNDQDTLAQRLPTIDPGLGSLFILKLDELEYLLSVVEKKWFPYLILACFQGIRPEEIAPKADNPKPRLLWDHFDWEFNSIAMPAEVAKGGKRPRTMPLHPVTRAWLEAYGVKTTWTGPICLENPTEVHPRATTTWGKALKEKFPDRFPGGWEADGPRHSYASYRNAILRNLSTVAEEMGNSVEMLHAHYHNPQTRQRGEAWFDFFPGSAVLLAPYLKAA